jgi:hypothetical protein
MIEQAFIWLGKTWAGQYLAGSTAAFAATEAFHIIALSLVGGAVLVADLAVLGVVLTRSRVESLLTQLRGLFVVGLFGVVVSGVLLVAAGPYKYYTNPLFPLKLLLLAAALVVQYFLQRRKWLAALSLMLWTAVVIVGRWLGLI